MIDHLCAFTDEAAAIESLATHGMMSEDGNWHWRSHVLKVRAYVPGEFTENADGTVTVVRPAADVPGFRLWLALDALDTALPGLEIAAARDAFNAGEPWLLHSTIPAERMAMVKLTPLMFGAAYSFS